MKEFRFSYFTLNNTVTIDEHTLRAKTGPFIKKEFSLNNLQHFYLFDNKDYRSVFLVYMDDKGKNKKLQLMSTPAEMGFTELVNELQQRFPGNSLNHLSEAEAFKTMKTANPNKWAPIAAFLIVFALMTVGFYPSLRHYFDFGFSKVNAQEIYQGKFPDSRNVTISGILLEKALEETTTSTKNGHTTTTVSEYIPMVDENWKEGDPVKIVLSYKKLSTLEYEHVFSIESHLGVVRDIAWEGLEKSQTDFFKNNYGLNIDKDAILIQVTNQTHNDEWSFYALLGVAAILGIIFLIVARKRRKG
jgi:hypothetical protein